MIEGSLVVKLPTIWTDKKQRRKSEDKVREEKRLKKIKEEKVRESRKRRCRRAKRWVKNLAG